jgi:L-cystine transport system permease protein
MRFDFEFAVEVFLSAITKLPLTIGIAFASLVIGAVFGLFIALLRFYRVRGFGVFFRWFVTIFKGTPMVMLITIAYLLIAYNFNTVAEALGLSITFRDFNAAWIGIAALAFLSSIGFSEIFRGALAAVSEDQYEAAYSIGETRFQALVHIILPQALPVSLPMSCNMAIGITKGVSILSLAGIIEVLNQALQTASKSYQYLEAYAVAALIYWALSIVIEQLFGFAERRFGSKVRDVKA